MTKTNINKNMKRIKAIAISILSIAAIATECVIAPTVTANAVSYQFPDVIDLLVSAPTLDEAKTLLEDLKKQMKERHIVYDISYLPLDTPDEINIARQRLEDTLAKTDEIQYANDQI